MSTFKENLKTAFFESRYNLCMENRATDPVYRQLEEAYCALFGRIRKRLGKKHWKLIFRLEALGNQKSSIDDERIYLQGMIDCAKLFKMIQMV